MRTFISICLLSISFLSFSYSDETEDLLKTAQLNNSLGLTFFSHLCKQENNFAFSPFSIYSSFSMLHQASADETQQLINYVLDNPYSLNEIASSY